MKTPKFKTCIVASVAIALAWLALPYASADVITLNFDSVDASTTPWKVDATAYLNANGITLSNVSDPGTVYIASDFQSGNFMYPSSQHNFLYQAVGGAPPCSYTLDFSTPLQSISFTRVGDGGNASTPTWSATAYVGAAAVGSVGDSYISAYIGQGPRTYTLSG